MDSKRDQVQAHIFMMGRLTSGMLRADPDSPESPQGRTNRGIVIGVIVAVIVAAGAFVIGLIAPGGNSGWREEGTLVMNKDTGSRYLFLSGRLHPLRNYASAKLLLGKDAKSTSVGSKSLTGTPHGAPVGIPGAPDALPGASELADGPWQLCSMPGKDSGRVTTLAIGHSSPGSNLSKTQGLLAQGPDGDVYLLWSGSKLKLDGEHSAAEALGYGSAVPVPVSAPLLSSLPAGPDLSPPAVKGLGDKGPTLNGRSTKVGQLFKVTVPGATTQMYLLTGAGLVPVTQTEAALALADARTRDLAYGGQHPAIVEVGSGVLQDKLAPVGQDETGSLGLPPAPPEAVQLGDEQGLCVQVSGPTAGRKGPSTSIGVAAVQDLGVTAEPAADFPAAACLPVDRITVPPGKAVLVHALSATGGVLGSTVYLVTDEGAKYRITGAEAAASLGYESATAVGMPSLLLSMLPTGPDLSPEAAKAGRAFSTAPRCAKSDSAAGSATAMPSSGPGASATPSSQSSASELVPL
ncbi:type VII secretion protein EccB [Streptomyces sp. NPDC005231]|uniref:type VII secretion protein EccB n=1 Tax=Streptomyces sp. NPDC005231 TaxID=3157026 RepID=UPI0033B0983D